MLRTLALAGLVLSAAGPTWAISEGQFQPAYAQFMQATSGDDSAIDGAAQAFLALVQQEPGNPVLLAYAGAATAMQATTRYLPWTKMRYAEDGLALLDKALTLLKPTPSVALQHGVPTVLEVRFVAANTFLAVPGFMNRAARGDQLLQDVVSDPLLATAPLGFQGSVWMKAAAVAMKEQRLQDARNYLNAVLGAHAPQAAAARAQLNALPS